MKISTTTLVIVGLAGAGIAYLVLKKKDDPNAPTKEQQAGLDRLGIDLSELE